MLGLELGGAFLAGAATVPVAAFVWWRLYGRKRLLQYVVGGLAKR